MLMPFWLSADILVITHISAESREGGGGGSLADWSGTHACPSTSQLDPKWRNPWCQNLPLNGVENVDFYP